MPFWRPRFRLRTLLGLTGVCGLLLAPVAVEFGRYRREEAVLKRFRISYLSSGSVPNRSAPSIEDCRVVVARSDKWFGLAHPVRWMSVKGPVTPDDITAMVDLPEMWWLKIYDATLGRPELDALAQLSQLDTLDLSDCILPDDGLRPLVRLLKLKELQLHNTGVPESAVIELHEALPGLEVLDD